MNVNDGETRQLSIQPRVGRGFAPRQSADQQLETEVRSYKASQEQSSIIGIRRRIPEDVYINFAGISQDNTKAIFQLYVFPLGDLDLGQLLYSLVRHHHLFDSWKGSTSVRSYGSGRYCRCAARDYNSALNSFLPSPAASVPLCARCPESFLTPDVVRVGRGWLAAAVRAATLLAIAPCFIAATAVQSANAFTK